MKIILHHKSLFRYFIELAYKGTPFCGWQLQPNGVSVQEVLERALGILLREDVRLTGAGRTDAGVHALYFTAHFDSSRNDLHVDSELVRRLNRIVPREIVVYRIASVPPDAHARFDAVARTYHYRIATHKNPFTTELAYHFYRHLDVDQMNRAAAILPEYKDFTSFSKLHGNTRTNLCDISQAYWTDSRHREGELQFVVTANRFLRNMVRAIVGTMIETGLGKYPAEDIRRIIQLKNRGAAGTSAPPQGLYLAGIQYPAIAGFNT